MGADMAVAELLSAEQYPHSSFEHDAEFVEGRLVDRPAPTWEHWPAARIVHGEGEFGRRIVTRPHHLCVEILSPEDTAVETMEKVREYLHFGVAWVWVIDPVSLTGRIYSQDRIVNVEDRIFPADRFSVDVSRAEY